MGILVPLLIAACGGDDPTAAPQQSAATNTPQPPPATATRAAPQPPPATATRPAPQPPAATATKPAPETPSTPVPTNIPPVGDTTDSPGVAILSPSKDDTLYETLLTQNNNGAGQWLFAGKTRNGEIRRGLIAFDIASGIPEGSTITGVSLTMTVSRTIAKATEIGLHRVESEWQEGSVDAFGNEGSGAGADAQPGDPSWTHRAFDTAEWDTPGGDFAADASATTTVDGRTAHTWASTAQLVEDVQSWLNNPDTNYGWLVLGDETKNQTTNRFNTKENEDSESGPVLVVEYRPG
jgi:hypothetical protein